MAETLTPAELSERAVNTIRFLAADAVQKANSGHPGLPMGAAAMAFVLWTRHLKFDPQHPDWPNRDRFILSAGHGSMLLYSLLHLSGFDLPLEQIQRFRQLDSLTPGHPEHELAPGVETTTGPLGQGFSNGVGMAVAAAHQAAIYNREGLPVVDHRIYAIVSDGDLMEGVASEAASLAGHLRLDRLIYLYDDNRITIDGSTDLAFTEDRAARFRAYGWNVQQVEDGNDLEQVDRAIRQAKAQDRPSLIVCRTHIGYGLPTRQDTAEAHGEPPGEQELAAAKDRLDWPQEPRFFIPEEVRPVFQQAAERGAVEHARWNAMMQDHAKAHPSLAATWQRTQAGELPADLAASLPKFEAGEKGMATRAASGTTLAALAPVLPELIGGSADLTGSNKTDIKGERPFSASHRAGRYLHFGVREHAMGGLLSGMALYGGLIPYGGTFLVFSDYMRPAVRLAAMMGLRVIYVYTHDSIGLGEDGPTHQPIEHLAALRAIPNLAVIRPCDANETSQAWLAALRRSHGPTALALTRQSLPTLDRRRFAPAEDLARGAYVLGDLGRGTPRLLLMASGSEVSLIVSAGEQLAAEGQPVRLVSFPCWELFQEQPEAYRRSVLPPELKARLAVEAAAMQGWERWVGDGGATLGMRGFGASAPYQDLYRHFGLTSERIVETARGLIDA
ncbi:MAG TPA: transketolase [Anaerolineales bacterium]